MILKCSVEPKAGFMAQYSNFREKTEPVWLKGRYAPKGKGVAFGIGWRRDTPESRYPTAAFLSALRGVSYGITSRELVRQVPTQNLREFPKTPLQQENFTRLQQAVQLRHSCGGLFHRVAAQPSVLPLSAIGGGRYSVP